jgi:hypothetical protein
MTTPIVIKAPTHPYILWYATGLHTIWGIAILVDPMMARLVTFVGLNRLSSLGTTGLGLVLLSTAILAALALVYESRMNRTAALACVMPQYALILLSLVTDIEIFVTAENPITGQPVDRIIIVALLGPVVWASILHTLGVLERYVLPWRY